MLCAVKFGIVLDSKDGCNANDDDVAACAPHTIYTLRIHAHFHCHSRFDVKFSEYEYKLYVGL